MISPVMAVSPLSGTTRRASVIYFVKAYVIAQEWENHCHI